MPDKSNGSKWWIRWLVGVIWGLLLTVLLFIGNGVVANDKLSRDRDTIITKECVIRHNQVNEKFDKIMIGIAKLDKEQCMFQGKIEVELGYIKKEIRKIN